MTAPVRIGRPATQHTGPAPRGVPGATRPRAALLAPATVACVTLLVLTLVAYWPFLSTGFAATDSLPLVETSRLHTIESVARLFTAPVMAGSGFTSGELVYRPFVSLTFGLEYLLWGLEPVGYHLDNLALHLVGVGALWLLLQNLGLARWSSLLGATLFALHPIVVAAVPVIGRRDSILPVTAFVVAAVLVLRAEEDRPRPRRMLLLLLSALLLEGVALLSKESAFVAVALLPLLVAARAIGRGASWSATLRSVALSLPLLVLAAMLFVWRLSVLRGLGGMADADLGAIDLYRYGVLIGSYARDLLWAYAELAPAPREIWLRLALLTVVWLAFALAWLPRRQAALSAAGALWVIAFGIFCAVFKITTLGWLAYFALVGLALLVAAAVEGAITRIRAGLGRDRSRAYPVRTYLATLCSAALLLSVLGFAVPALSASALLRHYAQWHVAGDVHQRYVQALGDCVAAAPQAAQVNLQHVPGSFDDGRADTAILGVTLIEAYTAQSALRLAFPDRPLAVRVESVDTLHEPEQLQFTCAPRADGVTFTSSYQ